MDDPANCTATFAASKVITKITVGGESDAFKLNGTRSGVKDSEGEERKITQNLEASYRRVRAASKSLVDLTRKASAAELNVYQREWRGEMVMGQDDSWDVGTPSDERMLVGSADLQSIVRAAEMDSGEAMYNLDSGLVLHSNRLDHNLLERKHAQTAQD